MNIRNRYTQNDLSPEELEQLTQQLLEAKFDQENSTIYRQELAEKHGIERPLTTERPVRRLTTRHWLKMAAGVLLLIGISALLFTNNDSYQKLTQTYLAERLPVDDRRKGAEDMAELRNDFLTAYENENYTAAIALGESLETAQQLTAADQLLLAMSYLYQQPPNSNSAIEDLQTIIAQQDKRQPIAQWYLALAYLTENDTSAATKLLEQIVSNKTWNYQRAARLLKAIE